MVLSLISAIGLGLGKIHICGISLGVTFVFFAGIIAGHFGLSIDPQMLELCGEFRVGNLCVCVGLTGRPRFLQFVPYGRRTTEYAGCGGSADWYGDDTLRKLRTGNIAAGYGGNSLWCYY